MAQSWAKDSAASKFLKRQYPDGYRNSLYEQFKFWAYIKKVTDWEGDDWQENPLYGNETATSDFEAGLAMQSNPSIEAFRYTPADGVLISSITNKLLAFAKSKKGAPERVLKTKLDAMLNGWGRMNARLAFGNGGGAIGRIGSFTTTTTSNDTIVLKDKYDACFFEKGMQIRVSSGTSADGSTSGDALRNNWATVQKVKRTQGHVVFSDTFTNLIPGAVANEFIFVRGQHGQEDSVFTGLSGHIPLPGTTISGSDSHFGVNRSLDEDRLAGIRYVDKAGRDIETVLFGAAGHMETIGGKANDVWLHTDRWADLANSLHSKTTYNPTTTKSDDGKFGFKGYELVGPDGSMTVYTCREMKHAYALVLDREALLFASAGEWPHFDTQGGDKLLVQSQGNGKQIRMIGFGQMIPKHPINICWATL